jgi:hypothetical protein
MDCKHRGDRLATTDCGMIVEPKGLISTESYRAIAAHRYINSTSFLGYFQSPYRAKDHACWFYTAFYYLYFVFACLACTLLM